MFKFKEKYVCQFCFKIHKNKDNYILKDYIKTTSKKKNNFSCCKKCKLKTNKEIKIDFYLKRYKNKINKINIIIFILLLLDVLTTWYLLTNISLAQEMNPFMNFLIVKYGLLISLVVTHLFAFGVLIFTKWKIYKENRVTQIISYKQVLLILMILYIIIIFTNSVQVILSLFQII